MNIRTAPVGALSIDELAIAEAHLGLLADRIHENGRDVPSVVKDEASAVRRELDERLRNDDARKLQSLRARREGLMTLPERRDAVEREIAQLEGKLGEGNGSRKAKTARK